MRRIYVADVGDGLCMAINTIFGETVQIDCGGRRSAVALDGLRGILRRFAIPDVFILSHFHIDHYNGLLYASLDRSRTIPLPIREAYYPRIPEFREKEKFVCCLFAMNLRVFGSETGVMVYDFLRAISRINMRPAFKYRALSKGDVVDINGSVFEILWPPAVLDDEKTSQTVARALEEFERAMEEDEPTRRLYDRVREEGTFRAYLEEHREREFEEYHENHDRYAHTEYEKKPLPEVVQSANRSLRQVANHLSLAFFEDNRILFLGDAGSFEIRQIVDDLKCKGRKNFYILITPHHGTHWDDSLREIECIYAISSNGSNLWSKMIPQFRDISRRLLATCITSDILMPIYPMGRFWRVWPWWSNEEI